MQAIAGVELDRRIQREVLFGSHGDTVPRFSSEDDTAMDLALAVSRRTGWNFHVSQSRGVWSVTWIEDRRREPGDARRRKIGALVTATASTQALAICRALLKAARLSRWPLAPAARKVSHTQARFRAAASLAS